METNFLKQTDDNGSDVPSLQDTNSPLSFLEWKQNNQYLVEKDASSHYNQYIIRWFANQGNKKISSAFLLRQKYLYLLDQLQLFFTEKEKTEWYKKINLSDENDLLLAIPFFAKKLKKIALYYQSLRKKIKNTKIKYNTIGTNSGLKQAIYNTLATTTQEESNELFKDYIPALSGILDSLVVEVEELYDDKDYFDKTDSVPVTTNYNLFHEATERFYNTKGISLSSDDWLFDCLSVTPVASFDSFVDTLTSQILEQTDADLYKEFVEKFLSEDKFLIKPNIDSSSIQVLNNTIQQGSNAFYYPYTNTDPTINLTQRTATVFLSTLDLSGATGGDEVKNSDTIFVKTGNNIKGAWLKYEPYNEISTFVSAQIKQNNTTKFLFPYPGYGLSSEDFTWTGPERSTTVEYEFLAGELKEAISKEYWTNQLLTNSCNSLLINNTTLAADGATSSPRPDFADQIFVQTRNQEDETLPFSEKDGSWLYEFKKTALPIPSPATGSIDEYKHVWPYQMLSSSDEYGQHLQNLNYNDVCNPIFINSLILPYAIASNKMEFADKIYKFNSVTDDVDEAAECFWLSGNMSVYENNYFPEQTGFTSIFESGKQTRFLWTGPTTKLDEVFKPISHNQDCPFVTNVPSASSLEWKKCTCKQVYYSPLGHPGDFFYKNQEMADFVALDTTNGVTNFDKNTWRDLSGNDIYNSPSFAWFQTYDSVGWNNGEWVNGQEVGDAPLVLEYGKRYFYGRAKKKNGEQLAFYSTNYNYSGTTNVKRKWVSAKLNEKGEWTSTDEPTESKLYAGDLFKYERASTTTSHIISSEQIENIGENRGSIWSSIDYLVSSTPFDTAYISWPYMETQMASSPQDPPFAFEEIDEIYEWVIQHTTIPTLSVKIESPIESIFSQPINTAYTQITGGGPPATGVVTSPPQLIGTYRKNKTIFSFTPPATGIYTITVKAKQKGGGGPITFTNIPPLTVDPQFREEPIFLQTGHPSSGFILEQPLYGWNYNLRVFDQTSSGAKPYWATLYSQRDENTKFKGVRNWGYSNLYIHEYLPDHHPKVSPLELTYGDVMSYTRLGYSFIWNQPIVYLELNGKSRWCKLNVDTESYSNLSEIFNSKQRNDLAVVPTTEDSDIRLATVVDGFAAEVTYYAQNSFVWNVSVENYTKQTNYTDTAEPLYVAQSPWSNLGNRFYATVATVPVLEEVYSESDSGGYFLPQHLGASMYINTEFDSSFNQDLISSNTLSEDSKVHIGGTGRSTINHSSVWTSNEKNSWMKGSTVAGERRGEVKHSYSKMLQTFVPYEETNSETQVGIIDTNTSFEPWSKSADRNSIPESFTGIKSVSAWTVEQPIVLDGKAIVNWTSDVYGNQYGVVKDLARCGEFDDKKSSGVLWTKLNNGTVQPASKGLDSVFQKFKTHSFYSDITGSGIKSVDCFSDMLMIETSGALLFCGLEFDYATSNITTTYDNVVVCDILSSSFKYEGTWFEVSQKTITVLFTELSGTAFVPTLYKLNSANKTFTLEFPRDPDDLTRLAKALSGLNITKLGSAVFTFDSTHEKYLVNYSGVDQTRGLFVIDFEFERKEKIELVKTNRFFEQTVSFSMSAVPPIVDLSIYGYATGTAGTPFTFPIIATNVATSWTLVGTVVPGVNITSSGVLFGNVSVPGTYYVNYEVSNSAGSVVYPLTLTII